MAEEQGQWHRVDSLILAGLILTVLITLIAQGESRWVGHAAAGVFGLVLMLSILATGGMLTGRLRKPDTVPVFSLHKRVSIWFSVFVIGAFLLGLVTVAAHGEPVLASLHGILGLLVAVFAAAQLVPSLLVRDRTPLRPFHRVIGYLLGPLVTLQVIVGVYAAVIGTGREIVLAHSVTGGIAGLLFAWIIIEMRNPGPASLRRAALAAYLAAALNVAGCWILGGYQYFTTYRAIRSVVLAGAQPWAHEIVMETKEHIFLFLPIVSILLALLLHALEKDHALAEETPVQKAVILTAALALFLVLLVFGMGVVISGAALPGGGP